MDVLMFSFNVTAPIVLTMALGVLLRYKGGLDEGTVFKLNKLNYELLLPLLIFRDVYTMNIDTEFSPGLMFFGIFGILGLNVALLIILRIFIKERKFLFASVHVLGRSNFLVFGLALTRNMFGDEGVRAATLLVPISVVLFNFVAVILLSLATIREDAPWPELLGKTALSLIRHPFILATVIGFALSFSGFVLPVFIEDAILPLSRAASPLCLVALGAQLDLETLKSNAAAVTAMCVIRLMGVPLMMLSVAVALGFRGMELAALLALFASPCGNTSGIMASYYGVYPQYTAQVVTFTTIFCGFTAFLWISLLRYLQFL